MLGRMTYESLSYLAVEGAEHRGTEKKEWKHMEVGFAHSLMRCDKFE